MAAARPSLCGLALATVTASSQAAKVALAANKFACRSARLAVRLNSSVLPGPSPCFALSAAMRAWRLASSAPAAATLASAARTVKWIGPSSLDRLAASFCERGLSRKGASSRSQKLAAKQYGGVSRTDPGGVALKKDKDHPVRRMGCAFPKATRA